MFGLSVEHLVILGVAGLFILGPEQLPGAAAWLARSLTALREYATGAREALREEMGPELEELRKPLSDLQKLRGLTPRSLLTTHLFDGRDPLADLGLTPPTPASAEAPVAAPTTPDTLPAGQAPPFDTDAT